MPIPRIVTSTRRSRPVFVDQGGETVSLVFETRMRTLLFPREKSIALPDGRKVFVIDKQGVQPVPAGGLTGRTLKALAFGLVLAVMFSAASKLLLFIRR